MTIREHGLSFGITRINDRFYMKMKVVGKLSHEDYETMVPMLEDAIKDVKEPKIKALLDICDFEGWELRAAWDDLKLGLKHGKEFEKIAVIGNQNWESIAATIANWFTGSELKYFEDYEDALEWIDGDQA